MGWFRPVHAKALDAREIRALLVARKLLASQASGHRVQHPRHPARFGLKMGEVRRSRFAARVRELVTGHAMLEQLSEPMLRAQEALQIEYGRLHREMLAIVKPDAVRPRLSTWRTVRDRRPPI